MDITPNERQQTFINIANSSFNTNPYRLQYELGGMAIEAIVSNNPFCPLEIVYCTKCFLYNPPSTIQPSTIHPILDINLSTYRTTLLMIS